MHVTSAHSHVSGDYSQLSNQDPLNDTESSKFASLFKELVIANHELHELESLLGEGWQEKKQQESAKQFKVFSSVLKPKSSSDESEEKYSAEEIQMAAKKYQALHSNAFGEEQDKKFNQAQQKLLDQIFNIVLFLRERNEKVEWECDTSETVAMMSQQSGLMTILRVPDIGILEHIKEEIEQHKNHSSELFLRSAQSKFFRIELSEDKDEINESKALPPVLKTTQQCVLSFMKLRKTIEAMISCEPVTDAYPTLALQVKRFGSEFTTYKKIALEITNQQVQGNINMMVGAVIRLSGPHFSVFMNPNATPDGKGPEGQDDKK